MHRFFILLAAAPYAFIETLRERMFKPSLSTVITENSKYVWNFIQTFSSLRIPPTVIYLEEIGNS